MCVLLRALRVFIQPEPEHRVEQHPALYVYAYIHIRVDVGIAKLSEQCLR